MKKKGWKLKSEITYTKRNPRIKEGIGLSAYTYSISKWVKTYKKQYIKLKNIQYMQKLF